MAAYDYVLRSKILHHVGTREANSEALESLNKAIEVDPEFAQAYAWESVHPASGRASRVYGRTGSCRCTTHRKRRESTRRWTKTTWSAYASCVKSTWNNVSWIGQNNSITAPLPRTPMTRVCTRSVGELMTWMGRHAEGIEWVQKAMRLDPLGASSFAHLFGRALLAQHQYESALQAYRQITVPRYSHHAHMAACHAQLGNTSEADREAAATLRLKQNFSIQGYLANLPYREAADFEHHYQSLRKAGLPE